MLSKKIILYDGFRFRRILIKPWQMSCDFCKFGIYINGGHACCQIEHLYCGKYRQLNKSCISLGKSVRRLVGSYLITCIAIDVT